MKISKVYHWTNNNVMVFDENGKQMPQFQGSYLEKRDSILANCNEKTEFYRANWGDNEKKISKELF